MNAPKLIAALLTGAIVGGAAISLANGIDNQPVSRDAICRSSSLTLTDQGECQTQMKVAGTEINKQQIALRYQSKIDAENQRREQLRDGAVTPSTSPASTAAK